MSSGTPVYSVSVSPAATFVQTFKWCDQSSERVRQSFILTQTPSSGEETEHELRKTEQQQTRKMLPNELKQLLKIVSGDSHPGEIMK